jgi:hypothetical protein
MAKIRKEKKAPESGYFIQKRDNLFGSYLEGPRT